MFKNVKGERIQKGVRAIGIIWFLLWLGSKTRRLWHDSFIYRLNSLLINCRSFRVLTKALFSNELLDDLRNQETYTEYPDSETKPAPMLEGGVMVHLFPNGRASCMKMRAICMQIKTHLHWLFASFLVIQYSQNL